MTELSNGGGLKEEWYNVKSYDLSQKLDNWYQALPYGFRFKTKDNIIRDFLLPINPSNISITTHFATNVIATLYGTIEEHSEQRYFDITIAGTTGMAPKNTTHTGFGSECGGASYTRDFGSSMPLTGFKKFLDSAKQVISGNTRDDAGTTGRASFPISLGRLGGFAQRTQNLLKNIVNNAIGIANILGSGYSSSAINSETSGYMAFHNFYRFLLQYKRDVTKIDGNAKRKSHPLTFLNYKDNNQYNVAIQAFVLTRNAEDPMLYNYSIVMRGYKLCSLDKPDEVDNTDTIALLGLDGFGTSIMSTLASSMRKARNVAYSALSIGKGGL
jgi:hypothetical protein